LRWENPPEGAKNLQGYSRHTNHNRDSPDFSGFGVFAQKREVGATAHQNRGRGELREWSAHRGGKERGPKTPEHSGRWWPPVVGDRRWERGNHRGTERTSGEGRTESLWLGRAGGLFLKRDMDAPDSLQCLSGAHRTAHSSCPVNHRTAHRKTDF
jgi:hypothetical protein